MIEKTTREVLQLAMKWLSLRSGSKVAKLELAVLGADHSDVEKLTMIHVFVTEQRKQPAALVQWLLDAIQKEKA